MSVPPPSNAGGRSMSVGTGPPSAGIGPQQQIPPQPSGAAGTGSAGGTQSQQNLNQIVLEYLSKKGYSRTEATLRHESAHHDVDGRPKYKTVQDRGGDKYDTAFKLLLAFVDENLDIYKPELKRLLWPVFVYSLLNCAAEYYIKDCENFYKSHKGMFELDHADDLRALAQIRLPEHLHESQIAKLYRSNKYRVWLTEMAFNSLVQQMELKKDEGGAIIIHLLTSCMDVRTYDRAKAGLERSIQMIRLQGTADDDLMMEDEGIPGLGPGRPGPKVIPDMDGDKMPRLNLDPMPMEQELQDDVKAQLQERDEKNPPKPGQSSLVEEFERRIKREPTDDGIGVPSRDIPLPPSLARDVAMEVTKVIEHRDRFKLPGRTGGVGPGVSVTMFTFHNTFGSVCCIDFSGDSKLVGIGTSESYIRVWSLDGSELHNLADPSAAPSSSKRLYGHSGPVYAISFSPSTANPNIGPNSGPSTASKYLLSCSADKTVRLWSLETWSSLVVYRSHDNPVWDVTWGPFGHYFLTGSHDRTARLWSTDHIEPLRLYVDHDNDVDCVAFHPNNTYIFTGSSDKSVRMWHITSGNTLRLFIGHSTGVCALACSPDGRTLASADHSGSIILWDIEKGRRKKRMRGHGPGGVWSLSWSAESTVLVSGGADGTVRVWDALLETSETGKVIADGGAGTKIDGGAAGASAGAGGTAKKAKGKDVVITPDQISAFPTKKSPVYKVMFTRMNLVLAGGAYLP